MIAGGGHMAIGVADSLSAAGRRIVVIEREEDRPHIDMLRAARHRVIIADATKEDVLDLAGAGRAAALVALTDSDPTNLHIALLARARAGVAACRWSCAPSRPSCRPTSTSIRTRSPCRRLR